MIVLCLFCLELLVCVALGWPIVAALLVGLVLFVGWALRQGDGLRAVGGMLWSGIRTAKNVLIVFLLIGVLTALWRACGTVPLLICYAVDLIHPARSSSRRFCSRAPCPRSWARPSARRPRWAPCA